MLADLEQLLAPPDVTDVLINGDQGAWVDRGNGPERDARWTASEVSVRRLAVELISLGGRHVDEAHPCVDVRLESGIRVHVVVPPISTQGTLISLRVPDRNGLNLSDLGARGMVSPEQADTLRATVHAKRTVLVVGGGGTGKTTLLAALMGEVPPHERIVTVEDVAELRIAHPHVAGLEARQPNIEGVGGVTAQQLVVEALRMRADRLVLGECRGAEVGAVLTALNTGHGGGGTTLHANSLADVPVRLEALGYLAGMPAEALRRSVASAFDLVVMLERSVAGRRVRELGEFVLSREGWLDVRPLDSAN